MVDYNAKFIELYKKLNLSLEATFMKKKSKPIEIIPSKIYLK